MAQSAAIGDRLEDARFRATSTSTSSDESSFSFYNPSPRANTINRLSAQTPSTSDNRALLQRRFTTQGVSTISSLSTMAQLRRQPMELSFQDASFSIVRKTQLLEKKQAELDLLKQRSLQFHQEMERAGMQVTKGTEEVNRLRNGLGGFHPGVGHQSEPTTPPEYTDLGQPISMSRPNRFSTSGIMSPPGFSNRSSRADSQATSNMTERERAYQLLTSGVPSQSFPGSRRDSNEDEDNYSVTTKAFTTHNTASRNRNSMPVLRRDPSIRNSTINYEQSLGSVDTSSFLLQDDFKTNNESHTSSRPASGYLSTQLNGDNFPVLIRSLGDNKKPFSIGSDGLELSHSHSLDQDSNSTGWRTTHARPNTSHSVMAATEAIQPTDNSQFSSPDTIISANSGPVNRHSMGAKMTFTETKRLSAMNVGSNGMLSDRLPTKLQTSFSTSSVPTVSSLAGLNGSSSSAQMLPMSGGGYNGSVSGTNHPSMYTAEQRLHQHNVSLGRIPNGAMNSNRQSRDVSGFMGMENTKVDGFNNNMQSSQSNLHAGAPSFGPSPTDSMQFANHMHTNIANYPTQGYGMGYSMHNNANQLNDAMQALSVNQPALGQWNGQTQGYQSQHGYGGYNGQPSYGANRPVDSQSRVMQQRRSQNGHDDTARFAHIKLDEVIGEIYGLCKDQHGCRFLQRKLEENDRYNVELIFKETNQRIVELMTDPFGNYLCQKLFEYTNDNQRTVLMRNAALHMFQIALNPHGTRALQKMIEFIRTPQQIQIVINALKHHVVSMIQDLNGNHVIQKCLNRLSSGDSCFIFDAVANNCIAVGTHRHGTCVLQRCLDHGGEDKKKQLVNALTACAVPLVQDPYGNYALQYILDLAEDRFTVPLCRMFFGHVVELSTQKFSSNVIEKCIRMADPDTKHLMAGEIIYHNEFDRLAEDAYCNYVFQTIVVHGNPDDKAVMVEKLRPLLPRMRNKPHGRRLIAKVQEYDVLTGGDDHSNGSMTPFHASTLASALFAPPGTHRASFNYNLDQDSNAMQRSGSAFSGSGNYGTQSFQAPAAFPMRTHRFSNAGPPPMMGHYQGEGQHAQQYAAHNQFNQHGMNFT